MHVPLETIWPSGYRWLQMAHMEHLLDITGIRLMLLIACGISLLFGITWIMDVVELKCLQTSPWGEDEIGQYACLVKLLGGCMLLLMFRHAAVALAYYDEDSDRMQQKKDLAVFMPNFRTAFYPCLCQTAA